MIKISLIALFLIIFSGCFTGVQVQTVEPWEGRYSTVQEFTEKTQNIELKDGQSIWVLSNGTMYRLLKKVEK